MNEILIFAGTTEGRQLADRLAEAQISHTVCVATEYGETVLRSHPLRKIHRGRMDGKEIRTWLESGSYAAVVDATHPYAQVITENIRRGAEGLSIPRLLVERESDLDNHIGHAVFFPDAGSCAQALSQVEGNILLTTGSKDLAVFAADSDVLHRLYVRVLPAVESLEACAAQGISGKRILALFGPFTAEMNVAMIRQYQIRCLVTKDSGKNGGYREKLEAARRTGIPVYVVGRPPREPGESFEGICRRLEQICGKQILDADPMELILAGVGRGGAGGMPPAVSRAIGQADVLLGAARLLESETVMSAAPAAERQPLYTADRILPYLRNLRENRPEAKRVVVLFSGDTGFYSGCRGLLGALKEEISQGRLDASVSVLPGISSVSSLAALAGVNYEDAAILSIHGKQVPDLARRIRQEEKLFLLMSGVKDVNHLGRLLLDSGLSDCQVPAGYQLSYPEQQILSLTPEECCRREEEGLYTCLIQNPHPQSRRLTHGWGDEKFIRGKTPMTKEEVREVTICKLHLHRGAVVYDIGSGTGSVAVEMAALFGDIQVYALEYQEEALGLMRQNRDRFQLENMEIVAARAPEGLEALPMPTHAFIGGSGGRLQEILDALYQKNPAMRVVLNAVTLETLCELRKALSRYPVEKEETVQLSVSRARAVGSYHLMQAENPVWICAFQFFRRNLS